MDGRNKQSMLLFSLWFTWFMIFVFRMSIKSILPALKTSFGSTNLEIGFAVAALITGYSLMQVPAGYYADRVKKRFVIISGIIFSAFSVLIASFSENLLVFISFLFLVGIGLGTYYPSGIGLITEWFDKESRGKAIGFHETASSAGSVIGPLSAGLFVTYFGWRTGFRVLSVFILLTTPFIYFFGREKKKITKKDPLNFNKDIRPLIPLIIIFTLTASGWMGFTTYLTSYLTKIGFSEGMSGAMFSIMPAISLFSMPVAGHFSDKLSRKKIIISLLLVSSPFIYLISTITSFIYISLSLVVIGLTLFASYPVVITYISDKVPVEVTGSAFGIVNAISMGFSALASPAVGYLIDLFNYRIAFLSISGLVVLSALIISFEKEIEKN